MAKALRNARKPRSISISNSSNDLRQRARLNSHSIWPDTGLREKLRHAFLRYSVRSRTRSLICGICFNFDYFTMCSSNGRVEKDGTKAVGISLHEIWDSSSAGCPFCAVLFRTHALLSSSHPSICWTFPTLRIGPQNQVVLKLMSTFSQMVDVEIYGVCQSTSPTFPWATLHPAVHTEKYTVPNFKEHAAIFDYVKHCLDECTVKHSECKHGMSTEPLSFTPKRLLHISPNSSTGCRLVEDHDQGHPKYAALSYCWGASPFIKTTQTNLQRHKSGIGWSRLPLAFQDSLIVCRRLGISYIWIDALCIIQDDGADWASEASQMARIYECAELVIGALSITGPHSSFLSKSPIRSSDHITIMSDFSTMGTLEITAHVQCLTGFHVLPHEPGVAALERRAWPFQERVLARRYIAFTENETQWECKQTYHCQCRAGAYRRTRKHEEILSEPYVVWQDFVGKYSARQLTYESDKLPAVAGIAKKIHEVTNSKYLAGLWKDNLLRDLCWRVIDYRTYDGFDPTKTHNLERASAPTFSWASVTSIICYPSFHDHPRVSIHYHAQLLEGECRLKDANPFGEVKSGYIVIEGYLLDGRVRAGKVNRPDVLIIPKSTNPSEDDIPMIFGCNLDVELEVGPVKDELGHADIGVRRQQGTARYKILEEPVKCLKILRRTVGGLNGGTDWKEEFILILGRARQDPGCYERLGYFTLKNDNLMNVAVNTWLASGTKTRVKIV